MTQKIMLMVLLVCSLSLSACGGGDSTGGSSSGGGGNVPSGSGGDWSGLGVKTKTDSAGSATVNHDDYRVDSHANLACSDCHATGISSEAICVTCHPFSKYQGLRMMNNVDHTAKNAGTHCNKCHYSNSGATANQGWRWPVGPISKTRIPHSQWHANVQGTCTDCHTPASETAYPANHYTSSCQNCHYYSSGRWAGGHVQTSTGCASCHTHHYSGYQCEWCHSSAITSGYRSWGGWGHQSESNQGCSACHGGGGGGG